MQKEQRTVNNTPSPNYIILTTKDYEIIESFLPSERSPLYHNMDEDKRVTCQRVRKILELKKGAKGAIR